MKERPILFKSEMVRAILDGRKTQTRRIVKCDIEIAQISSTEDWAAGLAENNCFGRVITADDIKTKADKLRGRLHPFISTEGRRFALMCPYGQPGDRLWVKETFYAYGKWEKRFDPDKGRDAWYFVDATIGAGFKYRYCAEETLQCQKRETGVLRWWKRPAIFMPRCASRIDLEITSVPVERLQDISEEDAKAEGVESPSEERDERDFSICPQCGGTLLYDTLGANLGVIPDCDCLECDTCAKRYKHLWETINGPGSWDANPWVWVIEFRRIRP